MRWWHLAILVAMKWGGINVAWLWSQKEIDDSTVDWDRMEIDNLIEANHSIASSSLVMMLGARLTSRRWRTSASRLGCLGEQIRQWGTFGWWLWDDFSKEGTRGSWRWWEESFGSPARVRSKTIGLEVGEVWECFGAPIELEIEDDAGVWWSDRGGYRWGGGCGGMVVALDQSMAGLWLAAMLVYEGSDWGLKDRWRRRANFTSLAREEERLLSDSGRSS